MSKQQGGYLSGLMNKKIDAVNKMADDKIGVVNEILDKKFIIICKLCIGIILLLIMLIDAIYTLTNKINQKLLKDQEK
tara:strand:- start:651 stop:884 length:234 start_codon:yes stop_codon:yes gene_type:complete